MKILKILLWIIGIIVIGVIALLGYLSFALPDVGDAPEMNIEPTPERVKRGEYLANHVALCMDCHAERDWSKYAGPPKPGTLGAGGEVFAENMGFPGTFISPNITPGGLKDWTDGEIFRAITAGVTKEGKALFPVMPYHKYGQLDEEDIKSIIAYLKTLEPVQTDHPESKASFPMNFIMNTIPKKAELKPMPNKSNTIEYGKYMITAAACYDCHTKMDKGKYVGKDYAGGMEFLMPDGNKIVSPNITPHSTGIGNWNEDMFVAIFQQYADSSYVPHNVKSGEKQTIMPWLMYSEMNEEDLRAIYQYLMTVEPVENDVTTFVKASGE
jgi:mono/diheme cytochrome c family protein